MFVYNMLCQYPLLLFNVNIFLSVVVADIISCVEYNDDGELLATGDKGGRVVIFQRDQEVGWCVS